MASFTPLTRLFVSATLISAWLIGLLVGWTLGGAVHLAFLGAAAIFPWRAARSRRDGS